jgi:hypothetical protein
MAGLNGSVADGELVPPAVPNQAPQEDPDAEANAASTAAYGQLSELLKNMPGIDYKAKFQPMIDQVQKRETTKMPSGMAMFAAALGAPKAAPQILASRWEQMNNEQGQKDRDLLSLQHAIMQGEVSQEIEKGNFAKALKQSEVLGKLQNTLSRLDREALEKEWNRKRESTTQDRMDLLEKKSKQTKELVDARVRALTAQFKLKGKMALALLNQAAMTRRAIRMQQDAMVGGSTYSAEEAAVVAEEELAALDAYAATLASDAGEPVVRTSDTVSSAPGNPAAIQARVDQLRAAAVKPPPAVRR